MNGRQLQRLPVLVVSDRAHSHERVVAHLRHNCHYDVALVSGDAALASLELSRYDALVIDAWGQARPDRDPTRSGFALIAEIKQRQPNLPCIVLANRGPKARVAALRAGASHALSQPVDPEELAAVIEQAIAAVCYRSFAASAHGGEQRANEKLAAIHRISSAISSLRDLDEILFATCRAAVELFDVDHSGLVLFEPDGSQGRVAAEFPAIGTHNLVIPVRGVLTEERLVQNGEMIVLSDSMSDPGLSQITAIWQRFDIRSVLIIPVSFQGRIVGSFSLDAIGRSHEFAADTIELCQIFAAQIAVAITNAELLADQQRRADQLEMVRNITLAITPELNRDSLLHTIIEQAVALLKGSSGGIYEYRPEREVLVLVADDGRSYALPGNELHAGEGMAGRLLRTGEPFLIVDDYNQWPDRAAIYEDKRPFGAVIEISLKWQDQFIGVLYVDDQLGRKFTAEDARLLQLFADHAAIALVNANLTAKETTKRQRLEQLARASNEIVDNLGLISPDERLGLIARHATEILQAECCGIFLVKRPGFLSLEASYGHREGAFAQGMELEIRSAPRSGLTGHIAFEGKLINVHGDALKHHPAVRLDASHHTPSGTCCSLLAIPLKRRRGVAEELIGLLRIDNKKDSSGKATPEVGFSQEDEWILRLFVHAAVVAIEDARLVAELNAQHDYLDRLIASLPNGIIAIDLERKVTRFNAQAAAMLHYAEGEVIGQLVDPLYAEPHEPHRIGKLLHSAPDHRLTGHQTMIRSKQGEHIPIELSATWVYNGRGERIGSVGYFEDRRSILETERRLGLLLEASNIVARAENLAGGLHSLADMMVGLLNTTFCRVFLLDEHHQFLVTHAVALVNRAEPLDWTAGQGYRTAIADWPDMMHFLETSGPKVLDGCGHGSRRLLAEWTRRLNLRQDIRSMLVIPLRAGDHVVGLIDLGEMRDPIRAAFTFEKLVLAAAIGAQAALLIDRIRLAQISEQRERLLANLDQAARHIGALRQPEELQQEIVRLSVELTGAQAGGLFACLAQELFPVATYGFEEAAAGSRQPYGEGLIGEVARTGATIVAHDYTSYPNQDAALFGAGFQTVVAVPLRQVGEVVAVVFVAGTASTYQFGKNSIEVLERFAVHAGLMLHTARLVSSEQRMAGRLTILHKISDYIQATSDLDKILQVVLTGITAGYGLRFNRAAVLLLDRQRELLIGQMGIGHLEERDARADWDRHQQRDLEDFGRFLDLLESGSLEPSPVCERIGALRLPLGKEISDIFAQVIAQARWQMVSQDDLAALPFDFIEAFRPALPLVVAPLIARGQVIGLLVADNKFTRLPITHETVDALLMFANTAAIAIDNIRLRQEAESIGAQLRAFFEASNALVLAQDPEKVLNEIVERACVAAQAHGVSVVMIDERAHMNRLISAGADQGINLGSLMRPEGISIQVMRSGVQQIIEDTYVQRDRVNPSMFKRRIGAALCIPVVLEGRPIGVMWFHYNRPRSFTRAEIDTIRLYVNQAAVAYDNARRIKELSKAHNAARLVARVMALGQPQTTLREMVEGMKDVLGCDVICLYAYDHGRLIDQPVTTGMWYPRRLQQVEGMGDDPTVFAMHQHDRTYVTRHTASDPFFRDHWFTRDEQIESCVAVPLRVGSERVGVLFVQFRAPHDVSADELANIEHFAHQASVAIHNAQLYGRLQKRAAALHALYEAGRAVTSSLDQNNILQQIVARAWRLVTGEGRRVSFANIRIVDKTIARAVAVYPPDRVPQIQDLSEVDLQHGKDGRVGIVGRAILSCESKLVGDTTRDPDYLPSDHETRSELAVPIWLGKDVIGAINVESPDYHAFDEEDMHALESLAMQAAIALRNGQIYEQMRRRVAALEGLYQASQAITGTLSLQETLDRLAEQACRVMDYRGRQTHFSLLALRNGDQLEFTAAYPLKKKLELHSRVGAAIDLRHGWNGRIGVTGRVASTGKSLLIPDVNDHPDYIVYADETQSELTVPMKIRDKVIGVINVEHPEEGAFDEEDQQVLEALAAQAAVAIENARLFEQTSKAAERLTAIHQISSVASKQEAQDQILQIAIREMVRVFEADQGGVVLFDWSKGYGYRIVEFPESRERGEPIPLHGNASIDWLLEHRRPLAIEDARNDPLLACVQPIVERSWIKSMLLAPLIVKGEVVGSIGLDATERQRQFTAEEQALAQTMANHVALAIENAQLHVESLNQLEEIRRTKEGLAAQATIAWMGMVDATWRHAIVNHALAIRVNVDTLRKTLPEGALTPRTNEILMEIQRVAKMIRERPITPPLSREEGAVSVQINDFLGERLRQIRENERYRPIQFDFEPEMDERVTVRINREWIRNVFDILIDNATEAMNHSESKRVTLVTRQVGQQVEIQVIDTGHGIPDPIRSQLGHDKIPKTQGERGMGMGVLLAQTIIQTYGGKIEIGKTSEKGTTIVVRLPVEASTTA